MSKKLIYLSLVKLVDKLEKIKNEGSSVSLQQVNELALHLETRIQEDGALKHLSVRAALAIQELKVIASKPDEEAINRYISVLRGLVTALDIRTPEIIFLLTAPFDEEAKTGDGQYAKSLVVGFQKHQQSTQCIWLKMEDGHYHIPVVNNLRPYPANVIPTVMALQPVANGKTVLSSYTVLDNDFEEAKRNVSPYITIRTPQLLYDTHNQLQWIGIKTKTQKSFFSQVEVIAVMKSSKQRKELIAQELYQLSQTDEKEQAVIEEVQLLTQWKIEFAKTTSAETAEEILKKIHDYVLDKYEDKAVTFTDPNKAKVTRAIYDYVCALNAPIKEKEHNIAVLRSQLMEIEQVLLMLHQLNSQFDSDAFDPDILVEILNKLSGITASPIEYPGFKIKQCKGSKPNTQTVFFEVLQTAADDPFRKQVILQLIDSMQHLGSGKRCCIDIHIRPPDTGAIIMPSDIELIKSEGILVNLTIHEYNQNYTRRYLQKMTHDLLRGANSVLFFNEKDGNSAIKASEDGDLHHSRLAEHNWPISKYELRSKTGYTVASQILSSAPKPVLEVIGRDPNILSFGTIRPGKGFEEALDAAILLQEKAKTSTSKLPIVIVAGDPQCDDIMQKMFESRYGAEAFQDYQSTHPRSFALDPTKERRAYWKAAKEAMEIAVDKEHLANPYLEIHPWCEPEELEALKNRCKYILRMDDMGMRNNGSAIIAALFGVLFTKWGPVTDPIFQPGGKYGDAVFIGDAKYGLNRNKKSWDPKEKIYNDFKRRGYSIPPQVILNEIQSREADQQGHTEDMEQSRNYKTVVAVQTLLTEHFTLQNSVNNLVSNFVDLDVQPLILVAEPITIPAIVTLEITDERVETESTVKIDIPAHKEDVAVVEISDGKKEKDASPKLNKYQKIGMAATLAKYRQELHLTEEARAIPNLRRSDGGVTQEGTKDDKSIITPISDGLTIRS